MAFHSRSSDILFPMKVSLISLNLNGAHFIGAFLDSVRIELDSVPDSELILLDNGSTDNSVGFILNKYPWIKLIQSSRNLGFAGGTHLAASQSKADYLIFLNNDMSLEPGFVDEILAPFEIDKDIGAAAGLILDENGTRIDYAGGDINLFGWGFQRFHNEPASVADELEMKELYPRQFFPCGGAVAMRRETWEKSGGFDPDYFAFFEDVDLGWRLNLMGLKTALAPRARVKHKHHGTAMSMPQSLRSYLLERNSLFSAIKNFDDTSLGKILPWAVAMAIERGLIEDCVESKDIFRGRWADDIWYFSDKDSKSAILGEIRDLREGVKRSAKKIIKRDSSTFNVPIRQLAIEEIFLRWEILMKKREEVQKLRKVSDKDIIAMMGEPYRTVTGHQREKDLMEKFRNNVQV